MSRNEVVAELLAEAKLAEKACKAHEERKVELEARIKKLLVAGDRPAATKAALALEETKADLERAQANAVAAREAYEQAAKRSRELGAAEKAGRARGTSLQALAAIDAAARAAGEPDEMARKLEEEEALAQAKLELALEGEGTKPGSPAEPEPPASSAEDLLREIEGQM